MAELSILEPYASQLQVMIDNALQLFNQPWFEKYFPIGTPQVSLTFETIIGRNRIEAAATVASRDGETPLRSRPGLDKMKNDIPVLKEMFAMSETDWRNYETLLAVTTNDEAKKQATLKILYDNLTRAGNSVMKRMDIFVLQGLSTGQINLTIDINPDGIVWKNPIDLLAPSENFFTSGESWDDADNSDPFQDIQTIVEAASAAGKSFSKMLVSNNVWFKFIRSKKVITTISAFVGARIDAQQPTLANVNQYLTDHQWPTFELVDVVVGIEKDGVITPIKPFNQNNVSFIPAGTLGEVKPALAIEELKPVTNVQYANFKTALLSVWSQNEPFREYTKVEWNAFPSFEAIDNIYFLTAIHA